MNHSSNKTSSRRDKVGKKLVVLIIIGALLIGSYLIYTSDAFISEETKIKRVIKVPEQHLEAEQLNKLNAFLIENNDFIEVTKQKGKYSYVYTDGYQFNNDRHLVDNIANVSNVDHAVISNYSVHGSDLSGGNYHIGTGFAIFLLNKQLFTWDVVDILILPIKEGQTSYSYPNDFIN